MMKRPKNVVIYALLALVALFTKACDCENERDGGTVDVYCVQLSPPFVDLKPGESKEVTIDDSGNCDPVTPVLPWKASSSSKDVSAKVVSNANSARGAIVRITRLSVGHNPSEGESPFDAHQWVDISLEGPGNPKHKRRVYGAAIEVFLSTSSSAATRSDQQFKALISAAPPQLNFKTIKLQNSYETVEVVNRSIGEENLFVEAAVGGPFSVSPGTFTLKRSESVRVTFVPKAAGPVTGQVLFVATKFGSPFGKYGTAIVNLKGTSSP